MSKPRVLLADDHALVPEKQCQVVGSIAEPNPVSTIRIVCRYASGGFSN
ncbi:MAG: hypothetical protein P0119_10065 [Nitrospira sp.]|nr:hypothetical protein [Nitrospira sp.]